MTISSTTRKAGPFIGAGTTTIFPFAFKVFAATDILLTRLNVSTGIETALILNTDYTVALNADQNGNPGGAITLVAGALATGFNLTLTSSIQNLQPIDLTNQGGFYPGVLNDGFDRSTIVAQQQNEVIARSIKVPVSDANAVVELPVAALRANKAIVFDAQGNAGVSADDYVNQALNAAGSAAAALASKQAALTSEQTALAYLNDFKGRYYGALASDPTVDPLGAAINDGDMYFNSTNNYMQVYRAGVWANYEENAAASAAAALVSENNAAASEANSVTQAGIATTQAGLATTARTAAEAARDAAQLSAGIYATTAAGLAATTSGQYFSVPSPSPSGTFVSLYLNSAGSAVFINTMPSSAYFDNTIPVERGVPWGVIDQTKKMAVWLDDAGKFYIASVGDVSTSMSNLIADSYRDIGFNSSGYYWAWRDSANNIAGGLNESGELISKGINITQAIQGTLQISSKWISPSGYWWYGDSLSASGVGGWLQTYLGKTVNTRAVGGQTAQQIAARFGGQVPLFTVTGNTIPASGAVAVTARTIDPITSQGGGPISGYLGGVYGTYTSDGLTYWTFTRQAAGSALGIDTQTPFLIDTTDNRQFGTLVFWYGRNNVGSGAFNADVKKSISDSIAAIKTIDKRFVILSVLNWPLETIGTGTYNTVIQLNDELKALYPNNYLDVRSLLIRIGGDGSVQDNADIANDVVPTSCRNSVSDGHLNNTKGNPIVATRVNEFLIEKGWN